MLKKCDFRSNKHKPNNKIRAYGTDTSGRIKYEFNSLGFRGEEYNQFAKKNIFVGGCSWTFGVGLNVKDTWPFKFKKKVASMYKLKYKDVNLMNFAVAAASNDYIVRVLLEQSVRVKPDLIICISAQSFWKEYIKGNQIRTILPNCVTEKSPRPFKDYCGYITMELALLDTLKNMFILQSFCKLNGINYAINFNEKDIKLFEMKRMKLNNVINFYYGLIDKKGVMNFHFDILDRAVDYDHAGAKSNEIFAERVFEYCEKRNLL